MLGNVAVRIQPSANELNQTTSNRLSGMIWNLSRSDPIKLHRFGCKSHCSMHVRQVLVFGPGIQGEWHCFCERKRVILLEISAIRCEVFTQ